MRMMFKKFALALLLSVLLLGCTQSPLSTGDAMEKKTTTSPTDSMQKGADALEKNTNTASPSPDAVKKDGDVMVKPAATASAQFVRQPSICRFARRRH